jgi:DsbC/DsbD-like thiol-disulfide interchange protein
MTAMRALLGAMLFAAMTASVVAQEIAGDWIDGERHRLRVFAGAVPDAVPGTVTAFVEMTLDKGWKTYWMNPGTAGGIPPEFSFEGSTNVAKAEVLFPVPQVMSDKAGDVIGYSEFAIFPLRITPADGAKSVGLDVTINYGICEKLCVPAETRASLVIPPAPLPAAGQDAERAYASVPRTATNLKPGDPSAFKTERQAGEPQSIRLAATFPGDASMASILLAVPDGRYLPFPVKRGATGEMVAFDATFANPDDLKALKGATVTAVLIGEKGQSEYSFVID